MGQQMAQSGKKMLGEVEGFCSSVRENTVTIIRANNFPSLLEDMWAVAHRRFGPRGKELLFMV